MNTYELVQWLGYQRKAADVAAKRAAKVGDYGEAQLTRGHAEAYAFALLHVQRTLDKTDELSAEARAEKKST